jgi:hypothetical protein
MTASWSARRVPSTSRIRSGLLPPRSARKADRSPGAACPANPSGARVQTEAAQCAQAVGHLGDRPLKTLRDGREVPLVAGGQRRIGLGGEVVGGSFIGTDPRPLAAVVRGRASGPA